MSRQEHLVMVQSFVGNAADMNEFLIASYKGFLGTIIIYFIYI